MTSSNPNPSTGYPPAQQTYQGIWCLLHLNQRGEAEDGEGLLDSGPSRRSVNTGGSVFVDPFIGPFVDSATGNESGSTFFPINSAPGETLGGNLLSIACGKDLSWQDTEFTIEFWMKIAAVPSYDENVPLVSCGGANANYADWEIKFFKEYNSNDTLLNFNWVDPLGRNREQNFPVDLEKIKFNQWQHFVFEYTWQEQSFDYFLDGESQGPFEGKPKLGVWDGLYIQQTDDVANSVTIGNWHFGRRPENLEEDKIPEVFKGHIAEFRIISGAAAYALGTQFTPQNAPYVDSDPDDLIEDPEEIVIERAFVNGLPKVYVESNKHFPKLVQVKTSDPWDLKNYGNAPGELYFKRPDPNQPFIWLYIYINVNADNEAPVYRWVPFAGVQKGLIDPITGNPWRVRRGNLLGEPF